jgi:hypothetical protein
MELVYLHVVQELKTRLVLAQFAKSKLSFCHHFASVVCRPCMSSVNFSHFLFSFDTTPPGYCARTKIGLYHFKCLIHESLYLFSGLADDIPQVISVKIAYSSK